MNKSEAKIKQSTSSFINDIERRSDFPAYYILGVLAAALLVVYLGFYELYLTNIISIIFPLYWTIKSFESPEKDDNMQWFTYWAIFTFYFVLDLLIPFYLIKIPEFYFGKLLFFIWLFLPATRGALFIQENLLSRIPINFCIINRLTENFKEKINNLINYALMSDKNDLESKETIEMETEPKEKEIKKSPEEFVREALGDHRWSDYSGPLDFNQSPRKSETCSETRENTLTGKEPEYQIRNETEKSKEVPQPSLAMQPEEEQHEARQNIVSDAAKINQDKIKTNLQSVRHQFTEKMDRLKDIRETIGLPELEKEIKVNKINKENEDITNNVKEPEYQIYHNEDKTREQPRERNVNVDEKKIQ